MRTFLALAVCSLVAAGCASTIPAERYESLSASAHTLAAAMDETSARIQALQRRFVVVTAPDSAITPETFRPAAGPVSFDLGPALRFREAVLDVVARYAGLLETLACKDDLSDVNEASEELAESAQGFAEEAAEVHGTDASKIGGLVGVLADVVTHQAMEQRKREGLMAAMDAAQPCLDSLAPLIASSCNELEGAVDLMRDRILAHANAQRPAYASPARYPFDFEIAGFLDEVASIHSSLRLLARGMAKFPRAHREIRQSLDAPAAPRDALLSLIQEGRRAKELMQQWTGK